MTDFPAMFDILSVVAVMVSIYAVWWRRVRAFEREVHWLLGFLLSLVFVHNLGNTLASLGLTDRLELYEDHLLIIEFGLWALVFYSLYRRKSERRLQKQEERLRLTLFGTQAGLWDWNVRSDDLVINDHWAEMVGYSQDELEPISIQTWNELVHPADLKKSNRLLEKHFAGDMEYYECEVRMKHKNGHWIWVLDKGRVVERDEDGRPLRMTGTHQEITELKAAQASLQRQINQLEALRDVQLKLASELDVDGLLENIVGHALELVDGVAAGFYRRDPDREVLDLYVHKGYSSLPDNTALAYGEGLIGTVWEQREALLVEEYGTWEHHVPDWAKHYGHRGAVGVPVVWGEYVLGVLEVLREKGEPFQERHIRLLERFAFQAAVAMHNAQLFEDARRRLERLRSLRKVERSISGNLDITSTLELLLLSLLENLEVDAGDVLLRDVATQTLEFAAGRGFHTRSLADQGVHIGNGQAGKVALRREVIHIPDLTQETIAANRAKRIKDEGFVSYLGAPMIAKGKVIGVLEAFQRSPLDPGQEWVNYFKALAGQAAIAVDHLRLFEQLQRSNLDLSRAYNQVIEGWARALELRDQETKGHSRRVEKLTLELAKKMGVRGEQLGYIRQGVLLHDIGKMGVPDRILQKPGKLTQEEWEIMKQHPIFAKEMLSPIEHLQPALDIPFCHHEKWDGSGYPRGLEGEEIPLGARIFAVVDVWDALRSDRPYRDAWPDEKALSYITEESGEHFDPDVVDAFFQLIDR